MASKSLTVWRDCFLQSTLRGDATIPPRCSGIHSDPNRDDHEEYIVCLVAQVIQVSLETVRIVSALPKDYSG